MVEPSGVAGDVTAAYQRGATWVAYRAGEKVVMRRIVVAADRPVTGPAIAVPAAVGEPTLATFDGRLALLLWRSADRPIGLLLIDVAGRDVKFEREEESNFASAVPVAAVEARDGESPALCIGRIEPTDPIHRSWTEIRRFVRTTAGRWREAQREWVNGEVCDIDGARPFAVHAAHRMALLWRQERGFEPRGRLYHFSGGATTADRPWSGQYITMQAARRETGTGWFSRPYFQPGAPAPLRPGRAGSATTSSTRWPARRQPRAQQRGDVGVLRQRRAARADERLQRRRVHSSRGPEPFDHRPDAPSRSRDARPARAGFAPSGEMKLSLFGRWTLFRAVTSPSVPRPERQTYY